VRNRGRSGGSGVVCRGRGRDFETDLDGVVGDERAFRPASLLEVDDIVVSEDLQVVVDALDIAVEALGQLANTIRPVSHNAPEELNAAVGEQRSEVAGVLEINDVRDFLTGFPAVEAVERVLAVGLVGVGCDSQHRGVVLRVAVLEEARLGFDVVHHDLLSLGVGTVDVVGVVGRVGFVRHGGSPLAAVVHFVVERLGVGFETGVFDVVVDARGRVVVMAVNARVVREVVEPEQSSTVFGHVLEPVFDALGVVVAFWDGGCDHFISGPVVECVFVFVDDCRAHLFPMLVGRANIV